jgi:hypothetical protein
LSHKKNNHQYQQSIDLMIPVVVFLQENEKSENNNDTQFLVMTTMLAVPPCAKVAPIYVDT